MRNLNRKNSHKEMSTMYHMFQYHPPKTYIGKIDDRTLPCVDIASLKTLYEKPKEKNSYKEKSAILYFQQVIN